MVSREIFLIAVASVWSVVTNAQHVADSLESTLQSTSIAADRITILNELAWLYRKDKPQLGITRALSARDLAQQTQNQPGLGDAFTRLGVLYRYEEHYALSVLALDSAIAIRQQLNDSAGLASCYNNLALSLANSGQYERAVQEQLRSFRWRQALGDTLRMIRSKRNVATYFDRMGDYVQSLETYSELLRLLQRFPAESEEPHVHYGLAIANYRLGQVDQSRRHLGRAHALWNQEQYLPGLSMTLQHYGLLSEQSGQLDSALFWLRKARQVDSELNDRTGMSAVGINIGRVLMLQSELNLAQQELEAGLRIAQEIGQPEHQRDYQLQLYELAKKRNQTADALQHLEAYRAIHDTLVSQSRIQGVFRSLYDDSQQGLEDERLRRFKATKRATLAEQAAQERNFYLVILGLVLLILGTWFLLFRARSKQRSAQQRQTIATLEAQSATALLEGQENERERIARDLHDRVGSILSTVKHNFEALKDLNLRMDRVEDQQQQQFSSALGLLDEAVAEVRRISHNMVSGVLSQFGLVAAVQDLASTMEGSGRVRVQVLTLGMDQRLDGKVEVAAFRIVQELLTNILKHSKASSAHIKLEQQGTTLKIVVKDNGKGFDYGTLAQENGMGLANVRNRAAHLGGLLSVDSTKGQGTKVTVQIPISV